MTNEKPGRNLIKWGVVLLAFAAVIYLASTGTLGVAEAKDSKIVEITALIAAITGLVTALAGLVRAIKGKPAKK